ncbi:hypothetical protein ASE01_18995 [Nocardioides sp. Root190]|uniref:hypothetical protein n=1 Tax=Nocardioides sp. Root190 TaxID=1736488 RepID=UPI0006FF35AC|nr:hypothetical protein [Nocardioides sp. Root190]KRB74077.1 hypothetical protein ASE01_18995 [Nocardioides sp. Root190]
MNDHEPMNDHDTLLGPALRERMRSEQPDLEHLATASLRAGVRLRRRRTASMVLGSAAAVAGIGVGGTLLAGGGTAPSAVEEPGLAATSPAAPSLAVGQVLDLGNGLTGTIAADDTGAFVMGESSLPGAGTGFVAVVTGPLVPLQDWLSGGWGSLSTDWPGITVAVSMADAGALGMLGSVDEAPVTVGAGWTCEWFLVDDKASCTADDGGGASLVIRDAADRAVWLGSTDKGDTSAVWTSENHDGIFISVQGGDGTTNAEVRQLGHSLAWVD